MPSIARCFKVARLAVQHLGPPLVRGVVGLAAGVVANMVSRRSSVQGYCVETHEDRNWATESGGDFDWWQLATHADMKANRVPGDEHFGTDYLPSHLRPW
jgi:hypothetical protein